MQIKLPFKFKSTHISLSYRLFNIVSGIITTLLIAFKFSSSDQGFFYAILAIIGSNILVELGFNGILIHYVSHLNNSLKIVKGNIHGNINKIQDLGTFVFKWSSSASVILFIVYFVLGYIFLLSRYGDDISLFFWIIICFLNSLIFFFNPFYIFLEGLSAFKTSFTIKLLQSFFSNFFYWILILLDFGLDSIVIYYFVFSIINILVVVYFKNFIIKIFFSLKNNFTFNWKKDFSRFQIMTAGSTIGGYLSFTFIIPLILSLSGPVEAGKFGITFSIMGAYLLMSNGVTSPLVSKFGMLISNGKYNYIQKLIKKLTYSLIILGILFIAIVLIFFYFLKLFLPDIMLKFISVNEVFLLCLAYIVISLSTPFSSFVRAHKYEPFLFLSWLIGLSTIALIYFLFSNNLSHIFALSYLILQLLTLPFFVGKEYFKCLKSNIIECN